MKNRCIIVSLLLFLTLGTRVAAAQTAVETFDKGNDDYRAGNYQSAIAEYQKIIDQGLASAAVYFNLGNAYYREGKIGPAILAYNRAQRLQPGDADIIHNLQLADLKTVDRIEPVPELFLIQWLRSYDAFIPFDISFRTMMAGWIVFFVALAGIFVLRSAPVVRMLRWLAFAAIVLFALSGSTVGVHMLLSHGVDEGIVMAPVVTAKSSPDEQSMNAFVIHEGLKVRLSDTLGDWVKITLADGKVGWIHTNQCERI
jgi:Tetratricopeptide repeat